MADFVVKRADESIGWTRGESMKHTRREPKRKWNALLEAL
jgi:hypothetical protein